MLYLTVGRLSVVMSSSPVDVPGLVYRHINVRHYCSATSQYRCHHRLCHLLNVNRKANAESLLSSIQTDIYEYELVSTI